MDKNRTLVEVTAKAICKADGYDPEGTKFSSGSSAENVSLDWEFYIPQATAAISAVYAEQKPLIDMIKGVVDDGCYPDNPIWDEVRAALSTLSASALQEGETVDNGERKP